MKQMTLAAAGFERYAKTTRRAVFLAEMERVVPWPALCGLIEPFYPKAGNGRPPVGVERMLRIYFLQQWYGLADEALHQPRPRHHLLHLGQKTCPAASTSACRRIPLAQNSPAAASSRPPGPSGPAASTRCQCPKSPNFSVFP